MKEVAVTVDNKGRLSIPLKVRKKLGINPGDVLFFRERGNVLEYAKAENPFEFLAEHALQESKDGKTISLEEFEQTMKKRNTTRKKREKTQKPEKRIELDSAEKTKVQPEKAENLFDDLVEYAKYERQNGAAVELRGFAKGHKIAIKKRAKQVTVSRKPKKA